MCASATFINARAEQYRGCEACSLLHAPKMIASWRKPLGSAIEQIFVFLYLSRRKKWAFAQGPICGALGSA